MKYLAYFLYALTISFLAGCDSIGKFPQLCPQPQMPYCASPCKPVTTSSTVCEESVEGEKPRFYNCHEMVLEFDRDRLDCNNLIAQNPSFRDIIQSILNPESPDYCNDVKKEFIKWKVNDLIMPLYPIDLDISRSNVRKCLCDEDIYIYEHPDIDMEEATSASSVRGEIGGEGGSISRNYIISPDGDFPPSFAIKNKIADPKSYYNSAIAETVPSNKIPLVAFLDSGLDPDIFADNMYGSYPTEATCLEDDNRGWNFIDDNNDTYDEVGHGTLVALSFIDALKKFPQNYRVLPVKVLDDCGVGTLYSTICGLYYAKAKGADIINNSWGMYFHDSLFSKAITSLSHADIHIVGSAGNRHMSLRTTEHYPSGFNKINSSTREYGNRPSLKNVYEVAGLCLDYTENCVAKSASLWGRSNFNVKTIAEPAMGYEKLIDEYSGKFDVSYTGDLDCSCSGTSYAAPRFTAALVQEFNSTGGITIDLSNDLNKLNPGKKIYSYWIKSCIGKIK